MKFPEKFNVKIRKNQVKLPVLRPWIERRVTELLGIDDEVVIEYAYSLIDTGVDWLDAKDLQINLQGFLHSHSQVFVSELWDLLLDAQQRADGIPLQIHQENEIDAMLRDRKPEIKRERVIEIKREPEETRKRRSRSRSRERRRRRSRSRSRERKRSRSRSRDRERRRRRSRSRSRSRERDDRRYRRRERSRSRSWESRFDKKE